MSYFITKENELRVGRTIGVVVIAIVALIILVTQFPLGTVGAGERGVQLRFNAVTGKVLEEGLFGKIPFVEKVKKMDVKIQKVETQADAASKDLQVVTATVAVNYHLDPTGVATLYKDIGEDFKARIIDPALEESVKAVTAKFTAEELITRRTEVRDGILVLLREKLSERGMIVDAFNIVNFNFSSSFNTAIEAKVTAEQSALEQKNKLEEEKYKAEQIVVKAKADAEAIRIKASAITQQGGKDYVSLEWVKAWQSGGAQVPQIMSGDNGFLLNIGELIK